MRLPVRASWVLVLGLSTLVLLLAAGCLADRLYKGLKPTPIPHQPPPAGLASLSAEGCRACHAEIYEEWAGSRMGQAFTEPIFQADWNHQGRFYYCLSCHAPLESQQPLKITGLSGVSPPVGVGEVNPLFDEALQAEGVTCVVCHLQEGALVGPHEVTAPHPTRQDEDFAGEKGCVRCHQLVMPPFPFSRADRPLADTHAEWADWKRRTGRTETCTDCHMPPVQRAAAAGAPERAGRRHTFPGGWDDALLRSGLEVGEVRPGPDGGVVLRLTNQTGHRFPTGDPARALIISARFLGPDGETLGTTERRIERKVRLPMGVELGDTTLLPAERREIALPAPDVGARKATEITVTLVYDRLANLPIAHPLELAGRRVELAQRTVSLDGH